MSKYKRCNKCKDWHYLNEDCNPQYMVNYPEEMDDDDWSKIYATSFENAALKYARIYNSYEYSLMNSSIDIQVKFQEEIKFFRIRAEPDVHYDADEIDAITSK